MKTNELKKIKTAGLNTRIMSTYTNDQKLLSAQERKVRLIQLFSLPLLLFARRGASDSFSP